jgi:CRISPR-associated protein Cas2
MSRTLYLVAYDIACPRRWNRVHRLLMGYKVAGQKSAYECWVTAAELRAVMRELAALIEPEEDRIHVFQLDERMKVRCYGVAQTFDRTFFMIA